MYDNIIKHAPKPAQARIVEYVQCVEEVEDLSDLPEKYGVKDIEELVQHLVEYECGTQYDTATDALIRDYKTFWGVMDKIYGSVEGPAPADLKGLEDFLARAFPNTVDKATGDGEPSAAEKLSQAIYGELPKTLPAICSACGKELDPDHTYYYNDKSYHSEHLPHGGN